MPKWSYYRYDWNTTGSSSGVAPLISYEWDIATAGWKQRKSADAMIDATDADSVINISIDTKATDLSKTPGKIIVAGTSGAVNTGKLKLKICTIPVASASTATYGGMLDTSSGEYSVITTPSTRIRKSVSLTNCPPAFKLRTMINAACTAIRTHVFVSFRRADY